MGHCSQYMFQGPGFVAPPPARVAFRCISLARSLGPSHVRLCAFERICMHVSSGLCTYMCACICAIYVYACTCMFMHVYACICIYLHVYACICMHTYARMCMYLYVYAYIICKVSCFCCPPGAKIHEATIVSNPMSHAISSNDVPECFKSCFVAARVQRATHAAFPHASIYLQNGNHIW